MPEPSGPVRPKVVVLDDYEGLLAAAPGVERMRRVAEVVVLDRPLALAPAEVLRDAEVVVALRERTQFDASVLNHLPRLKLILQTGGTANHVDQAAMAVGGVAVALGRGANVGLAAVPELTLALMVAASRHFVQAERSRSGGEWPTLVGRTLHGRRLGILGMGRLGCRVGALGRALGMDVVAWDRPGGEGSRTDEVPRLPLNELLATCDVVTIHLKLSPDSRGLLDGERLRSMRRGAVLINTARGAIVDEDALVTALVEGPLSAAGLDVFTEEPLPVNHPLRGLPNVVLTPHIGWTVEEAFVEFADIAADQLEAYVAGHLDRRLLLDPSVTL